MLSLRKQVRMLDTGKKIGTVPTNSGRVATLVAIMVRWSKVLFKSSYTQVFTPCLRPDGNYLTGYFRTAAGLGLPRLGRVLGCT